MFVSGSLAASYCIIPCIKQKATAKTILFYRLVQTMDYSVIVFDTAPTGHTLRLLQFPSTLEKGLEKFMTLKNKFGGLLSQVQRSCNSGSGMFNIVLN